MLIQAGLGSSTMYSNLVKGIQMGLITLDGDTILLTDKGHRIAQALLKCLDGLA